MSPADSPPEQPHDENSISPKKDRADKWVLTQEAFDKLLEHFSTDREEAAKRYTLMHLKLSRFFEYQKCSSPEARVEETFNRVARRIEEGQQIHNLGAYIRKVALIVSWEPWPEPGRYSESLDDIPEPVAEDPATEETEQKELQLSCLDECLDKIPVESRSLILGYYDDEEKAKIARRKLAEALGIPLNALRIRACRIRTVLEECLQQCLATAK